MKANLRSTVILSSLIGCCITSATYADTVWTLKDASGNKVDTLYAETQSGKYQVYAADKISLRVYIEENENGGGTGYYVLYKNTDTCPTGAAKDHFGNAVGAWGYVKKTHINNSESFRLDTGICNGALTDHFIADW